MLNFLKIKQPMMGYKNNVKAVIKKKTNFTEIKIRNILKHI
jgi:hypothetical protein